MDENVEGPNNDVFFTLGETTDNNLELFTVDENELYGVSHSGALSSAQGLINASFVGWAADKYNNMTGAIASGSQEVSTSGIINNLDAFAFPDGTFEEDLENVSGPADIVSVLAWDADSDVSTATIVTTISGVSDISEVFAKPAEPTEAIGNDLDSTTTPEPASLLGMLVLGIFGANSHLKRKYSNQSKL